MVALLCSGVSEWLSAMEGRSLSIPAALPRICPWVRPDERRGPSLALRGEERPRGEFGQGPIHLPGFTKRITCELDVRLCFPC